MSEMWDIGDKIGGMFEIRNIIGEENGSRLLYLKDMECYVSLLRHYVKL